MHIAVRFRKGVRLFDVMADRAVIVTYDKYANAEAWLSHFIATERL